MTPTLYAETQAVLRDHRCPKGAGCPICWSLAAVLDAHKPPAGEHLEPGAWDSRAAEPVAFDFSAARAEYEQKRAGFRR